jgi:hypothetical protein
MHEHAVIAEKAATTLYHMAIDPKNRLMFLPLEQQFMDVMVSTDNRQLITILTELELLLVSEEA